MNQLEAGTIDAIREIVNIGVGRAAGQLNQMTGSHIRLQVPMIRIIPFDEFSEAKKEILSENLRSSVTLGFRGTFSGITVVAFSPESAAALVMLLTGEKEDSPDLDPMRIEALKEVGNIIINSVMGSIANVLSEHLTYSLPVYFEGPVSDLAGLRNRGRPDQYILIAKASFFIESLRIDGDIFLLFEVGSLERLVDSISAASG